MEQKIITKTVFDDEFKQGVVDYTLQHHDESKLLINKKDKNNVILSSYTFINNKNN